jgi:UDP-N-acetyl-D-mannosaminuronic acid dehydrogenase
MDTRGEAGAFDVCVVGGAGHVGAPLALVLARHGFRTLIYDISKTALEKIASGQLPFLEEGGPELLAEVLPTGRLHFSSDIKSVAGIPNVILTIGTPIDEFHNPLIRVIDECIDSLIPHLSEGQLIILRSTVFPGVTEHIHRYLAARLSHKILLAFCPERVVQGYSVKELQTLPQIVSGTSPDAEKRAAKLFSAIAPKIVHMVPTEAEFAKLFSNAYRYIQFAATNQFYMMVEAAGLDYHRLLAGLKEDYPRMRDLPGPGLAAGPCLYKDTLQLAAFSGHQFSLGYSAIQVNEGLPAFLLAQLEKRYSLREMTVGLLGMAFKADSDDTRSSLSYKIKKLLRHKANRVLTTDPFVTTDPDLRPVEEVLAQSNVILVCVPHRVYRGLDLTGKAVVDIWNLYSKSEGAGSIGLVAGPTRAGDCS